jgi:hypothetical protein
MGALMFAWAASPDWCELFRFSLQLLWPTPEVAIRRIARKIKLIPQAGSPEYASGRPNLAVRDPPPE